MNKPLYHLFIILLFIANSNCQTSTQPADVWQVKEHYIKKEFRIPMRDGRRLFTQVYLPGDTSRAYPILMNRTPYNVAPYGDDSLRNKLGPSPWLAKEGYIFVYQDVRGRFMSEGTFVNMRPYIAKKSDKKVDESSDTFDTIEWLLRNIPNNNGRVGMWGISYPGFYTAMGMIDAHPALKAVSPQAPIADWFVGDDMHHNGAFGLLLAFNFFAVFGKPRPGLTTQWPERFDHGTPDAYQFFLNLGPLSNANRRYFKHNIAFWDSAMQHGTYDRFWRSRNILPHVQNIKPAVLVTGGWYDAEDLYGTLNIYQQIERTTPDNEAMLVMGPWYHGGWARSDGQRLGDITFGSKTSHYYQQHVELPFFNHHLKGKGGPELSEALCFDTGANNWRAFEEWPPAKQVGQQALYLHPEEALSFNKPGSVQDHLYSEYLSDPEHPVPFTNEITSTWGKTFMVEDQRFASRRPDVLVFESKPLEKSITIAGPLDVRLYVSTTGSAADWVVKVIDVYPDTLKAEDHEGASTPLGGYQRLLRAEIMRSKFRNSFTNPEAMQPGNIYEIKIPLNDIFHTFKTGHRIMLQIQSSWFPLFDRNPQMFCDIYKAEESDFRPAWHRVYHSDVFPSQVRFRVLKQSADKIHK